jgi:HSP20 family protein
MGGLKFRFPAARASKRCNIKFGRPYQRVPGHGRRENNLHVSDLGDKVQLSIDFPGVKVSDLKVRIEERVLSISGRRVVQTDQGVREVEHHRKFRLDERIDSSHVTANLSDGVLVVTAPKLKKALPMTIPITTVSTIPNGGHHGDGTNVENDDDDIVVIEKIDDSTGKETDQEQKPSAVDNPPKESNTEESS